MSVVIALVVVFVWWVLIVPKYKDYKEEKQRRERLATIRLPAGARLAYIENFPHAAITTASYSSESDCAAIEAYYREEFPKRGFVYSGEIAESKEHSRSVSFSATDYDADLSCTNSQTSSYRYEIILWSKLRD
jgi:hypothetical protein